MKKGSLEKRINKILNEEETFFLSLILLSNMHDNEKYKNLSELIFLFDNYRGFKQFIKYYQGTTIEVPTVRELKQALRLLALFQRVNIDKYNFDESYEKLKLDELGLSKEYCLQELKTFNSYLKNNGNITLKKIKKLDKLF